MQGDLKQNFMKTTGLLLLYIYCFIFREEIGDYTMVLSCLIGLFIGRENPFKSKIKYIVPITLDISLLKKYMEHVEDCEGVTFVSNIGKHSSCIEFTEEEKRTLQNLDDDINTTH